MYVTPAGYTSTPPTARAASSQQATEIAMLKQQAKAEESVVKLVETAVEPARKPASPPPGQGRHVDVRA